MLRTQLHIGSAVTALATVLAAPAQATEADPQTQTYEVVLALKSRPAGVTLLPGLGHLAHEEDAALVSRHLLAPWGPA